MRTQLFGVLSGPDFSLLKENQHYLDGIELRLDHFEKLDLDEIKKFIKKCKIPVMLTLRRQDQGGAFKGTEKERLALIESLCALEPSYIDLEYDVPTAFRKNLFEAYPQIFFLSSYHNFEKTPEDLDRLLTEIETPFAHIHKISAQAHSSCDALRMLHFVQTHAAKRKIMGISMGELGQASRILAPCVGGALMYASLSAEMASAPGQITAKELRDLYRFDKCDRQTGIYALIGDPVDKSLGHIVHNAVFSEAGLNAVYLKTPVQVADLEEFMKWARRLPFKGLSITMPHKEAILPLLDRFSPSVEAIGACNTVQIERGKLTGHNTDGRGAIDAIEKREKVKGKHLVVIGAGGAAKALIYEAVQRGAKVTVLNRTPQKALEIAETFGGRGGGLETLPQVCKEGYDVIINCIPESDWIEKKWILSGAVAMDIVYVPKNTPFLVKARNKKCRIVYGYEMFVGQATAQQQIWFPDAIDLDKAYQTIEQKTKNTL